jgi:hypothetical protein
MHGVDESSEGVCRRYKSFDDAPALPAFLGERLTTPVIKRGPHAIAMHRRTAQMRILI